MLMDKEISMTKVDVILLHLTPTSHMVGPIMDIREVLTTLLVDLLIMGGIFTSCQTLEGYFMGAPIIINLVFNHEVPNNPCQRLAVTMEVKVI